MSEDCRHDYTKGVLIGAFFGGLAGAITALLLAPKSGKELRQDLTEKSVEYYSKASNAIKNVEETYSPIVAEVINEGKAKAQNIIDIAKNKASSLISDAERVIQDAKAKANGTKDSITEKFETIRDAAKAGVDAFKNEYGS